MTGPKAIVNDLREAVADRYRCPKDLLRFQLSGGLSTDEGYFRFGPSAICYGRTSAGHLAAHPGGVLYDVLGDTLAGDGRLLLPFDPTEVIDNLRLERYRRVEGTADRQILKKLYYLLRPLTNPWLRKQVQRLTFRGWNNLAFPVWPVDTTVEEICERLLLLSLQVRGTDDLPFIWFWPNGRQGCVMMTHDVETESGLRGCEDLMKMDDSIGIKASFQIVPEGRYAVADRFLDAIRSRGFEVNVQDLNHDGRLYDDHEEFLRRAKKLNSYQRDFSAEGFRAAVLYRNPRWYDALDFSYDMSIPNVAHLDPQRGGCCTVMPYFVGKILELPVTTTQDYTLFHILNERSIELWKRQTELILGKSGLASFIVHPDYMTETYARRLYGELLEYLRDTCERSNIWAALPGEVNGWWRARGKMSLVRDGASWRIEGAGAERASLAYARSVNGKLVYELAAVSRVR